MNKPIIFFDYSGTLSASRDPIQAESVKCIKNIKDDYILTIVSSTSSSTIERNLSQAGIKDCFLEISGYGRHHSKPEKMKDLLTTYRLNSSDGLMITDTIGDIRAANSVSIKSIGVTWGAHRKSTLKQAEPDKIINDPGKLEENIRELI